MFEDDDERPIRLRVLLLLFVTAVLGGVVLFKFLIPGFPVIFFGAFALVWSLVFSLIDMRAVGTT
ncbi:hypothetical protein KKC44_06390, partial [Patescibacteria group bacterium]|nr:hypothetical protein [Patescibacteria group bacterium]